MGKTLRKFAFWVAVLSFSGFLYNPLAAMFSEPFFEALFDKLGWDTEDFAVPFLMALSDILSSEWFYYSATLAIGFSLGVWAHWIATKFDRKPKEIASKTSDTHLIYADNIYNENDDDSWKDIYLQREKLNIREAACLLAGEAPPCSIVSSLETAYEDELKSAIGNFQIPVETGPIPISVAVVGLPDQKKAKMKEWILEQAVDKLCEIKRSDIADYYFAHRRFKEVNSIGFNPSEFNIPHEEISD